MRNVCHHLCHFESDFVMLGAICGSAQSMDRAAQSVDPYFAQESMDCAGICGSRLLARSTGSAHRPAGVFFFRGTHNVRDELQLSHFVG